MADYLSILWNSFQANIVLSFTDEQILYAMVAFGKPFGVAFIVSVIGGTVAQFVHYIFGFYLSMLWDDYNWWIPEEQYVKLQRWTQRYAKWLLLLFVFPFYPVLPMVAGFFRVRPWQVVAFLVIAQIGQHALGVYQIAEIMQKMH